MLLDDAAVHARTCAKGGHIVRWLQRWLSQGRIGSETRVEQVLPEENGRLDVVFQDCGASVWVDVPVIAAVTACERTVESNARTDGAAARAQGGGSNKHDTTPELHHLSLKLTVDQDLQLCNFSGDTLEKPLKDSTLRQRTRGHVYPVHCRSKMKE